MYTVNKYANVYLQKQYTISWAALVIFKVSGADRPGADGQHVWEDADDGGGRGDLWHADAA